MLGQQGDKLYRAAISFPGTTCHSADAPGLEEATHLAPDWETRSRAILEHVAQSPFRLDENKFLANLRITRRGVAAGPSGMTADHLRPVPDTHLPRWSPLQVGRATISCRDAPSGVVEAATAPFQHYCPHVQGRSAESDRRTIVLSIDGSGAFDLISRKSMLEALMRVECGPDVMPFVRQFHCVDGIVHNIEQGERGEQSDPLMSLLYVLGQHASLFAIDDGLAEGSG